tara:strand:- start:286 stop:468 length:183 start_codon:yes stop_codon:yes gene_type:complete
MEIHDNELKKIDTIPLLLVELQAKNMTHLADEYIHRWEKIKKIPQKAKVQPKKKRSIFKR